MVARPLRATPERVEKAIAELRREGKRVGWFDGMVHGTALIRDRIGGEQSRVRSLIIMATVAAGERVPLGEVEEARRILRLGPPAKQRGPRPKADDATRVAAAADSGRDPGERVAVAAERVASAVEAMADAVIQWTAVPIQSPPGLARDGKTHREEVPGAGTASPTLHGSDAMHTMHEPGPIEPKPEAVMHPAMPATVGTARPLPPVRGPRKTGGDAELAAEPNPTAGPNPR